MIKKTAVFEEAISGFLGTVKDKTSFMTKPFEIFFSTVAPLMIWRISPLLGILAFVGDAFGFGPGKIGATIDKSLGFGSGEPNISSAAQKGAAENVVKEAEKALGISTEASLSKRQIIVEARRSGKFATYLRQMLRSDRLGFGSIVYGFIRAFTKGLLIAGLIGGAKAVLTDKSTPTAEPKSKEPAPQTQRANLSGKKINYLRNVANNVEDTVIRFLNADIPNFSQTFKEATGKQLKGSQELRKVLYEIEAMNYGKDIADLNHQLAFVAPSTSYMAQMLLPKISKSTELNILLKEGA